MTATTTRCFGLYSLFFTRRPVISRRARGCETRDEWRRIKIRCDGCGGGGDDGVVRVDRRFLQRRALDKSITNNGQNAYVKRNLSQSCCLPAARIVKNIVKISRVRISVVFLSCDFKHLSSSYRIRRQKKNGIYFKINIFFFGLNIL